MNFGALPLAFIQVSVFLCFASAYTLTTLAKFQQPFFRPLDLAGPSQLPYPTYNIFVNDGTPGS
jgi:hypothetical protein